MRLTELQEQIFLAIAGEGSTVDARVNAELLDSETMLAGARLGIYQKMYIDRLVETMATTYPTVRALWGVSQFRTLILEYVKAYPPRSYDLGVIYEKLPTFLAKQNPTKQLQIALEASRFEHLIQEMKRTPVDTPAQKNTGNKIEPEILMQSRFVFRAPLRIQTFIYRVKEMRSATLGKKAIAKSLLSPHRQHLMITASVGTVRIRSLEDEEHLLLESLTQGETLESGLGKLMEQAAADDLTMHVERYFRNWFRNELIIDVRN